MIVDKRQESETEFNASLVEQKSLANNQNQPNNIQDLTNEQLYELAEKDISKGAILISTQERYRAYVNWFFKKHQGKDLNLRLSKKKLPTKSLREQLVMIMRRFHPWKEELNKFVLRLEESGIFEAWGTKPLSVDVSINPNLMKHVRENLDEKLKIIMFIQFFKFLGIGCAISVFIFALEFLVALFRSNEYSSKSDTKPSKCKFSVTIIVCGISTIFLPTIIV